MGNIGRTCLLITIALAWALPVGAQVYNFHTYRELDGLPSNTVRGIVQDDDGVLWIATARGVSRYDGETWVNETQFGRRPGTYVSFIAKAADGRLWAHGAGPSGLLLIRGDDGWRVRQASPSLVREGGFAVYDLGRAPNGETLLTAVSRQGEVALFSETEDRVVALPDRQAEVNAVLFHDEGLLLATDRGLYVLDLLSLKFHRTEVTRPIHAVCAAEGGEIWYVGSDWIGRGPVGAPRVVASGLPIKLEVPAVGVVATADRAGGIYFADLGQVHYYHPDIGLEFLTRESGLAAVGATDIMVDREGLVWFTGLRGISKLVSRSLAGYDQRHGLYDNEVSAIEFLPDGGAVLGHIGGLTLWGDQPRRISFAGDNEVLERVTDLATDPQGRVWFAADNLGIGRLEADGRLEFEGGAPGTPPRAYSLLFDAEGRQWVGTNYQVLRQGDDGVLAEVPLPGLPHAMIRRLVQLADGTICIVTAYNGLFLSRDGAITKVRSPSYRAEQTYGVFERSPGEILVGTVEGLYVLDGDGLRRPGRDLPAIARPVYVILADREGRLWFGTDNGVLRWSAAGLDHFTAREGLLGADVNRDAMKLAADGSIWIGTDQGLNIHQPAFEDRGASAPTVTAGAVVADGMALAASGRYTLNRPPRQLEFGFHGVSFRDERRNRYQTRLEGFESAWQGPAAYPGGTVRYTNLPPGTYRLHVRMVAADGSLSPVATSGEVVIRPEVSDRWWFRALVLAGVLAGLLVLSLYVSGRRYARRLQGQVRDRTASLELSETRFRSESRRLAAILGSISDGVIALDDTGRVVLANAAAERLLGGGAGSLEGRAWSSFDLDPPLALEGAEADHRARGLTGAGGEAVWLEFSVAPLTDPAGRRTGRVLAFRNVTTRRELENQRLRSQQLESLGVLAGGIAHDFNNLLTIIMGNISLVEEAPGIRAEETRRLEQMKTATESARALTDQFLTFARGGDPDTVPTALAAIVTQAATLAFSGAPVSYELDLPADLWPVRVDRAQIGQVLNNLFLNAWQSMEGGGRVVISARNCENCSDFPGDERCVRLDVRDQGAGIAPDDLERIFDPYFTTKETGTGLGLAIAHSIVRRHGGALIVQSQPGSGSVFTLALPAIESTVAERPVAAPGAVMPGGRVLVLDDEAEVRDVCRGLLESLGFRYAGAETGEDALRAYAAAVAAGDPFDVVIMDLTVPGAMGGKEAVRRLLAEDPRARVIVASGYSRDPVLANHRQYGFIAALRKPFDREALRAVLGAVMDAAPGVRD